MRKSLTNYLLRPLIACALLLGPTAPMLGCQPAPSHSPTPATQSQDDDDDNDVVVPVDDDDDNDTVKYCNYTNNQCNIDTKEVMKYEGYPETFSAPCGLISTPVKEIGKCGLECFTNEDCNDGISTTSDLCLEDVCSNTTIPNNPPIINSTPITQAKENTPYTYQVQAVDPEGNSISCSLDQAPSFLNMNNCTITGTPSDSDSGTSHNIKVAVQDEFGNRSTQNYTLNIINTENLSNCWLGDMRYPGQITGVSDISVQLQNQTTGEIHIVTTDENGNWHADNLEDAVYNLTFNGSNINSTFATYIHSPITVNKTKHAEGKLDLEDKLLRMEDIPFIDDTIRDPNHGGVIKKWPNPQNIIWDVYTVEYSSGSTVDSTIVDGVVNAIQNEVADWAHVPRGSFVVNRIPTKRSAPFLEGNIYVGWNNEVGATNSQDFYLDKIITGFATFSISNIKHTWIHEFLQNMYGDGDSFQGVYSIFDEVNPSNTISQSDWMLSETMNLRPAGNASPDIDPQDVEGN